jgi:hypothetical protein
MSAEKAITEKNALVLDVSSRKFLVLLALRSHDSRVRIAETFEIHLSDTAVDGDGLQNNE